MQEDFWWLEKSLDYFKGAREGQERKQGQEYQPTSLV